jgi:thioesterase domain-containing protein
VLAGAEDESAPGDDPETLAQLLYEARAAGWEKSRATFRSLPEPSRLPRPVRLASGPSAPALVCVTAVVGMSDPVQYARLAKPFQGERAVWALRQPGFRRGEALPESLDLLLELHTGGLRAELGEKPFVLAGLSSGGVVAYALAQHLCARGIPPAGVVVVDSYAPADHERFARLAPGLGDELMLRLQNPSFATPGDNGWITAMLHYEKFACPLQELPVPVLFVRAETPLEGWPEDWQPTWPFSHTAVTAPGNHFTMLEEHAPDAAALIHHWMGTEVGS